MSSFRACTILLMLALIGWLPFVSPARAAAQGVDSGPAGDSPQPDCTAATTNAEAVPAGGNSHVTHWVTLDPYQGCNWHVEVAGGTGWISSVVVGSWSWRTVEFAAASNGTGAHRSATVRVLAGTAGSTQLTTFQVEQDPVPPGCTGFGDPQLNDPNPPEGGGGWGALVPLSPNMDCQGWAVAAPAWIHVTGIYNTLRNNQWYGHFFYTVDPNTTGQARSTSILVYQPGTSYESPLASVNQPPCTYGITGQPQQALPGQGGTYAQMQVTSQAGCPSQPAHQPAWIRFQGQSSTFDYDRNGPSARSGLLGFGAQNVTVQQASTPPETYRVTSKAILPTSHVTDPISTGQNCDGGVDGPLLDAARQTWLRGDNHYYFDPAPDGAFSGTGMSGLADARTLNQIEFTWDGSQISNVQTFHNIIESHRDFTYRHGDLFFSCSEGRQATTDQSEWGRMVNGLGHFELNSSVAVPGTLVPLAPTLDTFLQGDIDMAHHLTLQWREDPWTQAFRVERKLPSGGWLPLETYVTSNVSCIDLYGFIGGIEAGGRIAVIPPFQTVTGSVAFDLPAITQPQPMQVATCVDVITGHGQGQEPCNLQTLLPSLAEFPPQYQQGRSVLGATWPSCAWAAQSNASWLTPQSANGAGSGYVGYDLASNPTTECRYGSINYTSLTNPNGTPAKLSVTQLGLGPATRWNAAADFRPEGLSNPLGDCHNNQGVWEYLSSFRGVSRLMVESLPIFHHDADCCAASRSYWLPTTDLHDGAVGREGLGSRLILSPGTSYRAAVSWRNPGSAGYFNVAGSIQDLGGQGGHWYIDHGAAAIADGDLPGGATQPFNRSLLVNQGETVLFTYEAGPAYRSEASLDLTVTPTANPACSLTSNLVDVYLDANAHGGQTLTIAATLAGCPFFAQTSNPTQLAIAGADPQGRLNGITGAGGAASLTYNVASNPGQYREMTILVSMGQTTRLFTVHQTGADPCQVTDLNIYYQTVDSGTHNINLVVTTTGASCPFTVARTVGGSWLGLPGGGATYSGTTGANRQAAVLLNVAANQGAQRAGTLHFSPTQG
ncbi:MAG TPA: BACON domain-containing carbohydrate-binding protein, partial [Thermoanaerobaculia bacterium]